MKTGQTVMIYEDPFNEKKEEGLAILKRLVSQDDGKFNGKTVQLWEVRFLSDSYNCTRSILV